MLKTSCLTNYRCTRLQFRGVGPIWLIRELPCTNLHVEKIVSKVVIIAFHHLHVSKIPKKRRKNKENILFFPKTGIQTILGESPWESTAIYIFLCHFSVPS